MARRSRRNITGSTPRIADSAERTAERMAHLRSGAAGVHADQRARKSGAVGRTNRQGSRAARTRTAIRDFA